MAHLGKHAVVIGASMGGLLAARALVDYYDEATVLERDALPEAYEPRKGVPQGRHAHGLLARGREVLDQFFRASAKKWSGKAPFMVMLSTRSFGLIKASTCATRRACCRDY
jgi:2-polyprenyl-6-methoxyphenol hydroxylase-like FAD-dependent oxidoreductase